MSGAQRLDASQMMLDACYSMAWIILAYGGGIIVGAMGTACFAWVIAKSGGRLPW